MADQVKFTAKLRNARVLVIGGSSGIGFGVCEALLEHGGTVILSSSNPARVEKAIEKLKQLYPSSASRVSGHACNLGDEATLEANIQQLLEKAGQVDHIVHSAGDGLASMSLNDMTMEKVKQAGMVRFFSALLLAKHAPKYLSGGPRSSITLTTGVIAEKPIPNWTVINSYASGLQGMTRALALDLKPIRVNLIAPGVVDTELWDPMMNAEQKKAHLESAAARNPTKTAGKVEDVAEAYLYCMRDQNITGSMISTNSGTLLV